ncbi:hypothetical protein [Nocardia carnea]|uniref:Mce-associated membrane protein n=1 Tax=Nocardia carnea TaxID=37328 RepID=A0ABW7TVN2_9NOCA|nr:hypothetical protein [Nocardia carnea]
MPETATDPLILAAEQADAEAAAAEAEALAAQASATAARARARAAKLRCEAGEQRTTASVAESGTAGGAEVSPDPVAPDPAPSANTTDTGAVVETAAVVDAPERGASAAAAASSGAKTASPAKGSGTARTVAQGDAASSATPERDTATNSGPQVDTSKAATTDGDTATGSDAAGDTSKDGDSDSDISAGSGSSGDASKGSDSGSGAVTKNRASKGVDKVAGRLAAVGRRVKSNKVRRPSRRAVGRALVAMIVLVSLVAGGYSMWNHQQITAGQAREDEFLNAAREGVIALTTLDSGRATDDVKRVLDHSTGAFRTDFQTRSEDFTKVVEQSKVATQGEITAAAVESMTDESAVVLVSAVSRVTNSAGAQQEPRVWRLSVTVTRDGSELKMSKVEFVP